jgi:hypothetical protein
MLRGYLRTLARRRGPSLFHIAGTVSGERLPVFPAVALAPSRSVVASFGVDHEPIALAGGEDVTFRAGNIVLKRVHDAAEAEWTQDLVARIEPDGFRVAKPVPTADGQWVHDRWSATEFIPGLGPAAPRWNDIVQWGLRFGDAAERERSADSTVLDNRTHRWAIADRVAWADADVPRHRRWAAAVVVADAVVWNGAGASLAREFAATAEDRDLLARALIFRLVAEQLAADPRHGGVLEPYRAIHAALR